MLDCDHVLEIWLATKSQANDNFMLAHKGSTGQWKLSIMIYFCMAFQKSRLGGIFCCKNFIFNLTYRVLFANIIADRHGLSWRYYEKS